MATPVITPNMFLTEPAIGNTLSPTWAQNLNADIVTIDQHNHTPGEGVQIPPAGLNINSSLSFQGNNLIDLNSAVFSGAISGTPNLLSIYTNGTDLFYEDVNGNSIQLTKLGAPNAGTGNIQGLPSTPIGGAGISWVNGQSTFQFLVDAGTVGANTDQGTAILRYPGSYPTPSGTNYIALQVPSSIPAGYALTLPASPPGATSLLQMDPSGNLSVTNTIANPITIGSGGPVLSNSGPGDDNALLVSTGVQFGTSSNAWIDNYASAGFPSGDDRSLAIVNAANTIANPIVVSANPANHGLKIVRGYVASDGTVNSGEGFGVTSLPGPGEYTLTFSPAFFDIPAVVVSPGPGSNPLTTVIYAISSTGFSILIEQNGVGIFNSFSFIAIGQR